MVATSAALPLEQRKRECELVLRQQSGESPLRYSPHFETDGPALHARACELGLEGIVSKRRDQSYRPGRGNGWLKTKCLQRRDFVIGGFTEPRGSRSGIGAVAARHFEGASLRFAGKVGTGPGFTAQYLTRLRREFESIAQPACPFDPPPPGWIARGGRWVLPLLQAEVTFLELTDDGQIRHGSLLGCRAFTAGSQQPSNDTRPPVVAAPAIPPAPSASRAPADARSSVRGVTITSPDRVVYPELPFSKRQLAELYGELAEWMLPYVANRPLTLVRCERGVRSENALRSDCRFLPHEPEWYRWATPPIRRVQIREQKKIGEYLVVDSPEGLVGLIQGDIIEVHVWNAKADDVERPDRIVFDLDPGTGVAWARVVQTARLVRDELASLGLQSWPKLTGGKGVHVVLPFQPQHGWPEIYAFAFRVAQAVVQRDPKTLTLDFGKSHRDGRILIDYKRNHRAAVAVAAYSTRARPAGPVGVPLSWRELTPAIAPNRWTVRSVLQRLKRLRRDPWAEFWRSQQRLGP